VRKKLNCVFVACVSFHFLLQEIGLHSKDLTTRAVVKYDVSKVLKKHITDTKVKLQTFSKTQGSSNSSSMAPAVKTENSSSSNSSSSSDTPVSRNRRNSPRLNPNYHLLMTSSGNKARLPVDEYDTAQQLQLMKVCKMCTVARV